MTFKDASYTSNHSYKGNCGIPEHNNPTVEGTETEEGWESDFNGNFMNNGLHGVLEERYQDPKMMLIRDYIRAIVKYTRADERKKFVEVVKEEREICRKVLEKATHKPNMDIYEEKIETCDDILAKISQV